LYFNCICCAFVNYLNNLRVKLKLLSSTIDSIEDFKLLNLTIILSTIVSILFLENCELSFKNIFVLILFKLYASKIIEKQLDRFVEDFDNTIVN